MFAITPNRAYQTNQNEKPKTELARHEVAQLSNRTETTKQLRGHSHALSKHISDVYQHCSMTTLNKQNPMTTLNKQNPMTTLNKHNPMTTLNKHNHDTQQAQPKAAIN
jgi:hypothetical protein